MPGAGGLPMMAYTARLRPKGFRLQVYKSVGVSLVEVYKWVGQSVIWVCEKAYKSYKG